ncbi:DUF459 domain-containing protein [Superficieibacter electus]|uniref:DUF459 domain-containing protein n=1 Tax=Superficieibacter electus TaxID=2022662 RepID=A0A2P5GW32_9ENTR|nr:SGNH family hydrolase [Superficieibacter electus]POP47730.1 DUF459 domain-containing protein [Superficieibacter electus]POP50742.1 DUF459 domain-containing protein [Superficieibacter electus]
MQTFDNITLFARVYKFLYIMLLSTLFVVWLNQRSLTLYWQQEFHEDAPWSAVRQPLWLKGGKILAAFYAGKEAVSGALDETPTAAFIPLIVFPHAPLQPSPAAISPPTAAPSLPVPHNDKEHIYLTAHGKVFFAGDSMMQGIAPHIMLALNKRYGIQSINKSKQSTGLTLPGFFDWPLTISETLQSEPDIELLVVFLGPNDPWSMKPDGGGQYLKFKSPEWEQLYRSRIERILQSAQQKQIPVIWIGPPNMRKKALSDGVAWLDTLYASAVTGAGQYYLPANDILGYQGDTYSDYQDKDGRKLKLRTGDGIHFTPYAQKLIAARVLSMINVEGAEQEKSVEQH